MQIVATIPPGNGTSDTTARGSSADARIFGCRRRDLPVGLETGRLFRVTDFGAANRGCRRL
ncbi:hypothetical protein A3K89_15605 [Rhodococcoides kyotonense]|uniref:Uncharacterized protein n=1 Tax=Rhodococcoides kyotonense TaxID=398843 RepID=A0A177YMA1_9NOCA|nr:hypothetical protein A3K89_15605 [Rhodococcus kyotonensis]